MLGLHPTHRDECIGSAWIRDVAPERRDDPLTLIAVRDEHLRCTNGSAENGYVERLIRTSLAMGERVTRRLWLTQSWRLKLDAFPSSCADILIDKAPLLTVSDITYVDPDGNTQTFGGSPLPYEVENTSLETNTYGRIRLAYGEVWPTTRCQRGAVTVSVDLGYAAGTIPEDLTHGRLLMIGELYKQRSESVASITTPALIRARDLWMGWRVY